jgi:anti-anti-sigma factor
MSDLRVVEAAGPYTHVALAGRLDAEGVDAVEVAFTGHTVARRLPTIVDLSEVTFLASLGMGMILRAARTLKRHDAGLVLLNPPAPVEKALRNSLLDEVIPVARGWDEALRLLRVG